MPPTRVQQEVCAVCVPEGARERITCDWRLPGTLPPSLGRAPSLRRRRKRNLAC